MIILLLATMHEVMGQKLTNQRLFDTIPFIMHHHENRLEFFSEEPMTNGGIIFLGNSITEGGDWAQLTGRNNTLNRGIGGDIAYGILNRLDDIIVRQPEKLFLLIGINDIGKDIPGAVIADNVDKILRGIQSGSPETQIFLQSILPVNVEFPGFPQHYNKEYHILMTNQLLYRVAVERGVEFVNLFPWFLDDRQRMRADLVTDGLHLNEAGYQLWVKILQEAGHL